MTLILAILALFCMLFAVEQVAQQSALVGNQVFIMSSRKGWRGYHAWRYDFCASATTWLKLNWQFILLIASVLLAYHISSLEEIGGLALMTVLPDKKTFTVNPVDRKVKYIDGRVFCMKFDWSGGEKNYLVPIGKMETFKTKLPVAATSYWYVMHLLGLAAPYIIEAHNKDGKKIAAGAHNNLVVMQHAQEWCKERKAVIVGDGKQLKGYMVKYLDNPVIRQMLMENKLMKESTRFNGNHFGITSFSGGAVRMLVVDWQKVITKKFLGTLGDGPAITPHSVSGIGEGNAYQWRITDVEGKIPSGDVTDKGSMMANLDWSLWCETCEMLQVDPTAYDVIASKECFKFPKRDHMTSYEIDAHHLRFVGVRNSERQKKSALTMAGVVTAPVMWPIITRLVDYHSRTHDNVDTIVGAATGSYLAIEEIFKAQMDEFKNSTLSIAGLLFKIPGADGLARHPRIKSTVTKLQDRVMRAYLRNVRKVPMTDGGSRMIAWLPTIEKHVVDGSGYFPCMMIGQCMVLAWDCIAKTYGDADGDDICWIEISNGIYLVWRNPVNGINAFSICIDVNSNATEADIPEWVMPLVEASKVFHYIPEPASGKPVHPPVSIEEAVHRHMQEYFNAYLGGAKLGAATQDVYKYSFIRHINGSPFTVQESCMWAGKLEMEIVKGIKSNNKTAILMTTHPSKIFMALRNDRAAFLPGIALRTLDEFMVWDLFCKKLEAGSARTLQVLAEAAETLNGKYDEIPLVYVTKKLATMKDLVIVEDDNDRVMMARIAQHIRNKVLDLFTDVDVEVSLQIKNNIKLFYNRFINSSDSHTFTLASMYALLASTLDTVVAERCEIIINVMEYTGLDDISGSVLLEQYLVNKFYESKGMFGQELYDFKMNTVVEIRAISCPDCVAYTTGMLTVNDLDAREFGIQCLHLMLRTTLAEYPCNTDTMVHAAMRIGADVFQDADGKGQNMFYMCFSAANLERATEVWRAGATDYVKHPVVMEFDKELVEMFEGGTYHQDLDAIPYQSDEDMDELAAYYEEIQ